MDLFAGSALKLECIDRLIVDTMVYVIYDDGAYRHVIYADDWDRPLSDDEQELLDADDLGAAYTQWCQSSGGVDDDEALQVAAVAGLGYIHSTTGTCSCLQVSPVQATMESIEIGDKP